MVPEWPYKLLKGVCVCVFQTESERQRWKPVLVMLTEKDLLLFDSMPRMREHWLSPTHTYPLLATRYTLTHSITAVFLLVHTNTPLENQSWYTHLHTLLFNACLCTHTCKHSHFLHASWQCWSSGNWNTQLQSISASWKETIQKHYGY